MPKLFYHSSIHGHGSNQNLSEGEETGMVSLELPLPFQWGQALYVVAKLLRKLLERNVH